jgi:hypothetical protein
MEKKYVLTEEQIRQVFIDGGTTLYDLSKPESWNEYLNRFFEPSPPLSKQQERVDKTFWKRLELFVSNVQVNDMASEEEKDYILLTAKEKGSPENKKLIEEKGDKEV